MEAAKWLLGAVCSLIYKFITRHGYGLYIVVVTFSGLVFGCISLILSIPAALFGFCWCRVASISLREGTIGDAYSSVAFLGYMPNILLLGLD